MSNYGRVRRGPMGADRFTQISNALFRDRRISFKAKGLFGLISTHRDGYGVTPESLAAAGKDGVSAVKGALRELEEHGYLVRERERREDGTLGGSQYYITDMPDPSEQQSGRSEPEVENPPVDCPPVENPTVEDRPHKKTNSSSRKNTSGEKTISLSPVPEQQTAEPAAVTDERETDSPSKLSTAQKVVRAAGVVREDGEAAFIAWATAVHAPRGGAWWRTVAANGDLPDLVAAWRAERPAAQPEPAVPPWCGKCDGEPVAERWVMGDDDRWHRCPDCSPHMAPVVSREQQATDDMFDRAMARAQNRMRQEGPPLTGTDARVAGWLALSEGA